MKKQNTTDNNKLIYGVHPVEDLLARAPQRFERLYLASNSKSSSHLEATARSAGINVQIVDKNKLEQVSATHSHQGVVGLISPTPTVELAQLVSDIPNSRPLYVALDEISDPQNLGAILRACAGAGVSGVILPKDRSADITAVVRKASAGASERLSICRVTNLVRALEELKKNSVWVVGTAISDNSNSIYVTDVPFPVVVVLGSEGKGIRPLVVKTCDLLVEIPMYGDMQSLNVSQAASVVLFELAKRIEGNN